MADGTTLYLVRHGIAAERGPEFPDDSKRPLTAEGKEKLREIGSGLVALGIEWDVILTSPFTRARQTAEILAEAWLEQPPVVDVDALAVGGRHAGVYATLGTRSAGHIALVGHMPDLGTLAAEVLGTSSPFDFKKGAIACIALQKTPGRGAGTLLWFAPPRLLRLRRRS